MHLKQTHSTHRSIKQLFTCVDRTLLLSIGNEKNFVRRSSGGNRDRQILRPEKHIRELKKEIGVTATILDKLGENEYIANKPDQGKVVKHVSYYLTKTEYLPLVLEKKGGLDEARWFLAKEVSALRTYDDIKPLFEKAIEKINNTQ